MKKLWTIFSMCIVFAMATTEDPSVFCAKNFKNDLKQICIDFCVAEKCQTDESRSTFSECKALEDAAKPILEQFNSENDANFVFRARTNVSEGVCGGFFYVEGESCDPSLIDLRQTSQWNDTVGYWAGDIVYLNAQANVFESFSWNYPYVYKGFSIDNVVGNKLRRRTLFLYPPQNPTKCPFPNSTGTKSGSKPMGTGICGINGNTKALRVDQTATVCNTNGDRKGDMEGAVPPYLHSYSRLTGRNDTIVTHLLLPRSTGLFPQDRLLDAETTTISKNLNTGNTVRVRTTQLFDGFVNPGESIGNTYFRERKLDPNVFWSLLDTVKQQFAVQDSDLCAWAPQPDGSHGPSGVTGGYASCRSFLEQSLELA